MIIPWLPEAGNVTPICAAALHCEVEGRDPILRDLWLYKTSRRYRGKQYFLTMDIYTSVTWLADKAALDFQVTATLNKQVPHEKTGLV